MNYYIGIYPGRLDRRGALCLIKREHQKYSSTFINSQFSGNPDLERALAFEGKLNPVPAYKIYHLEHLEPKTRLPEYVNALKRALETYSKNNTDSSPIEIIIDQTDVGSSFRSMLMDALYNDPIKSLLNMPSSIKDAGKELSFIEICVKDQDTIKKTNELIFISKKDLFTNLAILEQTGKLDANDTGTREWYNKGISRFIDKLPALLGYLGEADDEGQMYPDVADYSRFRSIAVACWKAEHDRNSFPATMIDFRYNYV
ncbi:hypothetical protein CUJ83_01235 [Methanocella sp. CWC-04]|uniref:Uncharacterized protein n=1 Tax=Methanooceanicella nereidis TaxID=2052831 RepID=A0AAP2W608_9EURY|nr:hypothetical protein [Methanocella sp. CWC-04]MCD1293621.1 hypothetical protein [Methanocella sp. CWC-04]